MSIRIKGRLLGRKTLVTRKTRCDETRCLLISDSSSELSVTETQILDPLKRTITISARERGFAAINRTGRGDDDLKSRDSCLKCNTGSCNPYRCDHSGIMHDQETGEVRLCLRSPLLTRRRNAICDEIEKRMIALPGRTLRQRRVDMLRGISLMQFSLF